jgi:hypothetical protein
MRRIVLLFILICGPSLKLHAQKVLDYRGKTKLSEQKSITELPTNMVNPLIIFLIRPNDEKEADDYKKLFNEFSTGLGIDKLLILHDVLEGSDDSQIKALYDYKIASSFHYIVVNPYNINTQDFSLIPSSLSAFVNIRPLQCVKGSPVKNNFDIATSAIKNCFNPIPEVVKPLPIEERTVVELVKEKYYLSSKSDSVFAFSNVASIRFLKPLIQTDQIGNQFRTITESSLGYELGVRFNLWVSKKRSLVLRQQCGFLSATISSMSSMDYGSWENNSAIDSYGNSYSRTISVSDFSEEMRCDFNQFNSSIIADFGFKNLNESITGGSKLKGSVSLGIGYSSFRNIQLTNQAGVWNIEGKYPQINQTLNNIPSLGLLSGIDHSGKTINVGNYSFISIISSIGLQYALNHKVKLQACMAFNFQLRKPIDPFYYEPNPYDYLPVFNPRSISSRQTIFSCGLVYSLF